MKVLIIGGVAGGASTAARLRRLDESAEIIIFERGEHISFANCGLPYYCGDVIKERSKLLLLTPKQLQDMFNVEARVNSEVIKINRENKTITILDKQSNVEYEENYDKLVISTGAAPIRPNIQGINDDRIFTLRNVSDADAIKDYIRQNKVRHAVVVGGGFIGLEMAENLVHLGLNASLVEASTQVLAPVDIEFAAQIHNHIRDKGVDLHVYNGVKSFESSDKITVTLNSGHQIRTDIVILAIGVRPESKIASEAGLQLGQTGGISVNEHMLTSDDNIYAIGDVIEVKDLVSGNKTLIPLAGPANRQGRIAAENIHGLKTTYEATQGTSILQIFDFTVATTGNNEKQLIKNNVKYMKSYTPVFSHAEYYPEPFPLVVKLLFSPDDGKILGAQVVGIDGVDKRIDVIATALKFEKTVYDLANLELSYAPPYGSAKDPVNLAGMNAQNVIEGKLKPVYYDDLNHLTNDHFIIDLRAQEEQVFGRLPNSHNIPLGEVRSRMNEIPRDKKLILYCNKGKKSYFASRILLQSGYDEVYSLAGGYSIYKQVMEDRQPHHNASVIPQLMENLPDSGLSPVSSIGKTLNQVQHDDINNAIEIDACGMQCPGPIMRLTQSIKDLGTGSTLKIKTTDPGFKRDIQSWCKSTGNQLVSITDENKIIFAVVRKGIPANPSATTNKDGKTMVVFSNDLDKALASFIIANGAAATGKNVTMFFTFWGLNILRKQNSPKVQKGLLDRMFGMMMPKGADKLILSKLNMMGMGTLMMKHVMSSKNVSTLNELMEQARDHGVKFIACQMSLDVMGIKAEELISGVEIGGVATYINAAENSDLNLFI